MKTIEELLRNLARPEVLEFALASDRLPCVKVGGSFQPVDGAAPSTDAILQMLVGVGGSRYVESLSTKPTQWTTRIDALGTVSISAIMRNDVVQARFTLTKREVARSPMPPPPESATTSTVTVAKDTITKTDPMLRPDTRQEMAPAGAEDYEPEPADDDEPTLMTQPTAAAPARSKLLDLELDDTSPRAVAAPRPPSHAPVDAEDRTAEIDLATIEGMPSGGATGGVIVVQNPDPSQVRAAPASPRVTPPLTGMKDTIRNIHSIGALGDSASKPPASSKASPPSTEPERRESTAPMAARPFTSSSAPPPPPLKDSPSQVPPPASVAPPAAAASLASPVSPTDSTAMSAAPVAAPTAAVADTEDGADDDPSVFERARIVAAPGAPVAGGLGELLALARLEGASDLHVIAGRPALVRIAGALVAKSAVMDVAAVERLAREAVPKRCNAALDGEGSCDFALDHPTHGRFRVNFTRQRTGLKGCFRVIAREMPSLVTLGLPEAIAAATHHNQGLILLTGPTGHGKTSTLAALVDKLNRETSKHIVTVEDPVEFIHPRKKAMMSQREVGTHTRSLAAALKGSLREDPDVIVIGELRDSDTVRMALSASETGHLVIGTMNTPSAAKTIDRLIDLFPASEQQQVRVTLAGALRLIVSQRLVPSVDHTRLHAAAEVLPSSFALYTLIRDDKTFQIPSLQQRGKALGNIRLDESLADLVRARKTSLEDARVFADAPDDLESMVGTRPLQKDGSVPPAAKKKPPTDEQAMDLGGLLSKGSLFGKKGS